MHSPGFQDSGNQQGMGVRGFPHSVCRRYLFPFFSPVFLALSQILFGSISQCLDLQYYVAVEQGYLVGSTGSEK